MRLECEQNQYLSSVIPILYGALLSYAMYVFASLLLDLFQYYGTLDLADSGLPRKGISLREFLPTASLFLLFTFFVVEDLGEIVKLSQIYPLRRTSRYSHEVVIAGLLLGGYAFLGVRSILAVVLFGTAIGWGGIWCNQLKEEYFSANNSLASFARTQRALQYIGAAFIVIEGGIFLVRDGISRLTYHHALCVGTTLFAWLLLYSIMPPLLHGPDCSKLLVNTIVPDSWILRLQHVEKLRIKEG